MWVFLGVLSTQEAGGGAILALQHWDPRKSVARQLSLGPLGVMGLVSTGHGRITELEQTLVCGE